MFSFVFKGNLHSLRKVWKGNSKTPCKILYWSPFSCKNLKIICSLRSRRLEVVGAKKKVAREWNPLFPLARPFFLSSEKTSKRLIRGLNSFGDMFSNLHLDQHILSSVVLCFLIIRPVLSYTRSTSWLTLVLLLNVFFFYFQLTCDSYPYFRKK